MEKDGNFSEKWRDNQKVKRCRRLKKLSDNQNEKRWISLREIQRYQNETKE